MNDRECLEGIIDLAVFDPASGSWLILDWKTNRTTDADLPAQTVTFAKPTQVPRLFAGLRVNIGVIVGDGQAAFIDSGLDEGASTRLLVHAAQLMQRGVAPRAACAA